MPIKRHNAEQIVSKLRQIEVLILQVTSHKPRLKASCTLLGRLNLQTNGENDE